MKTLTILPATTIVLGSHTPKTTGNTRLVTFFLDHVLLADTRLLLTKSDLAERGQTIIRIITKPTILLTDCKVTAFSPIIKK